MFFVNACYFGSKFCSFGCPHFCEQNWQNFTQLCFTINFIPDLIEYLSADQSHQKGEFVILVSGVDKNNKVDGEAQLFVFMATFVFGITIHLFKNKP
jgi:hypothetical protein